MADCFPDSEVTGIDLADVFPKAVHPNVFFEVDDAEIEWERPDDHYDLVHFRNMIGAFCDWSFIYSQAFRVTKPGGWIELLDFDEYEGFGNFFSFFRPDSIIQKIGQDLKEAALLSGRPRGVCHLEPRLLYDAGFENITVTEHAIPLSPKELSTGHLFLRSTTEAFEAVTHRLLTKYKGWAPEEVRFAKAVWQNEMLELMSDPEKASGFFVKLRVVTAKKPAKPQSIGTEATLQAAEHVVAE